MLNRMLRLHICKSNSRSVTVAKNVLASTSCLKSQENGPSRNLREKSLASTRAYKIHIVVKNVLFCTPYPQSHIHRSEGLQVFLDLIALARPMTWQGGRNFSNLLFVPNLVRT